MPYSLLAYLLAPVYLGVLLWRGLRERGYWQHLGERFGFGRALGRPTVWVHAASVGEVQVAAALVRALRRTRELAFLVTTATPAGAARARALFAEADIKVRHAPLDLPGAVRRFFARAQPRLAVIIETELWPNLYRECARRGVPLILASARLSARSARRYRLVRPLIARTLSHVTLIAAQSEADAARFRALGAEPARTRVAGNLKFDFTPPDESTARGQELRARYAAERPVWVAGSTHAGEEQAVLRAHEEVCRARRDVLLVLAPRHPQRFEEVAAALARQRIGFARLSRAESCGADTGVLLADSLGQLIAWYAAADVAFVGGSLVPIGGHNLLEPAALGRAILTGPHNFNAEDIARALVARGGARIVHDAPELAASVSALLANPAERARMGESARGVLEENRGALGRLVALIEPRLPPAAAIRTAAAPEA